MDRASFESLLAAYDYAYPESAVALTPASPREHAKVQVYKRTTQEIMYATFADLPQLLPKNAVLVCNDTKVIPARLFVEKVGGGTASPLEMFVTTLGADGVTACVLSNRHMTVGDTLSVAGTVFELLKKEGKESVVRIVASEKGNGTALPTVREVIERAGHTPLPPYLKATHMSEHELRREYQSVFAHYEGSVAAPTASLHFSDALLDSLAGVGISRVFVTLHVGLGTFAPLTAEHVATGRLHSERYSVPRDTVVALRTALREGRPIIPIGTTALRTIESIAPYILSSEPAEDCVGETSLFITPPYTFQIARGLITNFHIPRSSLMMLVASMVGRDTLLSLYHDAIEHNFRLFSFGDGQCILE